MIFFIMSKKNISSNYVMDRVWRVALIMYSDIVTKYQLHIVVSNITEVS